MSYCVNCGVELHASAEKCVLCGTKVINPKARENENVLKPFPVDRKKVEVIYYRMTSIIITTVLVLINIVCFVINFNMPLEVPWSLIVFGATLILWTLVNPYLLKPDLSSYIYITVQAVSVSFCLFLVGTMTTEDKWLFSFALPITLSLMVHILFGIFAAKKLKLGVFGISGLVFFMIGTFNITVEFFINMLLFDIIRLSWSLIVAICCVSVMILLFSISKSKFLKEEAKKRLRM